MKGDKGRALATAIMTDNRQAENPFAQGLLESTRLVSPAPRHNSTKPNLNAVRHTRQPAQSRVTFAPSPSRDILCPKSFLCSNSCFAFPVSTPWGAVLTPRMSGGSNIV